MFFSEDEFDKAFGVSRGLGLAAGGVRELANLVIDALFLKRAFGFANRGDLWVAVGAAWEVADFDVGCDPLQKDLRHTERPRSLRCGQAKEDLKYHHRRKHSE